MWQHGTPWLVGFWGQRRIWVPTAALRGLTLEALCDSVGFPALFLMDLPASRGVKTCENSFRNWDDFLSVAASQCCALTADGGIRAEKGKSRGTELL